MARIRSTHPGQWTDENFILCSYPARLLAIALRNEADDNGIFEWKPHTIKMRLFPADNVEINELLSELLEHNIVAEYEIDRHHYGAIRNFRKYQRPKYPKSVYTMTDEIRKYVGLKQPTLPPNAEKPKADGGDKMEEIRDNSEASASDAKAASSDEISWFLVKGQENTKVVKNAVWDGALAWLAEHSGKPPNKLRSLLGKWCKSHGEPHVLGEIQNAAKRTPPPVDAVSFLAKRMPESAADALAGWGERADAEEAANAASK